ncbi:hypothetical protein ES705_15398 [subsurface metagenome]
MNKVEKKIRLIFGKRGCGKSELARILCQDHKRLIIYDTLGEYTAGVIIEDLQALKEFWGLIYRGNFRIIYQPVDPEGDFDAICKLVNECGDLTFLVEELDRYSRPLALSQPFKEIIQRGRHRNIELIGVTQRPHGIDKLLTSQAKEMFIFNTTEPRDIDYFKATIGYNVVCVIAGLQEYEYLKYQDGVDKLVVLKETIRKWNDLTESPDE